MSSIRQHQSSKGFTLIEMMIAVILMGILVAMTIPLGGLVESFRLDYVNQRLYASVALARSEAIKRGIRVGVCSLDLAELELNNNRICAGTGWTGGWMIYADANSDGTYNTGEEMIRVHDPLSGSYQITWTNGNNLAFIPRGSPVNNGQFTVCVPGRIGDTLRHVNITTTGQIRKSTTIGDCL